ncbi:MAG: isoaspartyl peptidase/L-asparaginase [Candidatus Nezhaarchaeales archaeon]
MPTIVLHGGAGRWEANDLRKALEVLRISGEIGFKVLNDGGSSLDAVVESVSFMEESGVFNAGRGSCKDALGNVSLDAGVMWMNRAGAVAYVKATWNAVRLARIVMEETNHVLLVGDGADELARKKGLPPLDGGAKDLSCETVGAIALDKMGRLASAISTGGIKGKMRGRVGDTPIPGAGFWVSKLVASCSTGYGEAIMMAQPCRAISTFYEENALPLRSAVIRAGNLVNGPCGLIALNINDEVAAFTTAEFMPIAIVRNAKAETFVVKGYEALTI